MDKEALLAKITTDRKDAYTSDEIREITEALLSVTALDAKEVLTAIATREDEPSRELMMSLGGCDELYTKVVTAYGGTIDQSNMAIEDDEEDEEDAE